MSARFSKLSNAGEMTALVKEIGFLPLFHMGVPDFSVEALTPGQWWTGELDDPWGWRESAAGEGEVIYAKLFASRAGFVSREWFPRLANYRRNGYDFDSRWEEGLASPRAKDVMRAVEAAGGMLFCDLKRAVGADKLTGTLALLQMQTYLIISGFGHRRDRFGQPYGWSICEYAAPESAFGADIATKCYNEAPEDSFSEIMRHMRSVLPGADEAALSRIFA